MDVVAFSQSVQDPDDYLLVRAYDSLEHLHASQEAFYATDLWRNGPRESIIALIENNVNVVVWLAPDFIEGVRNSTSLSTP